MGYGRGRCERFPPESAADAIRFHVATDGGALVKIQYVFEKDCWPGEHGVLESSAADETLRRQADAFLESYLRRRNDT